MLSQAVWCMPINSTPLGYSKNKKKTGEKYKPCSIINISVNFSDEKNADLSASRTITLLLSRELSLQNGQRARLSSRAAAMHLSCLGIVTCPSIGEKAKPNPYILKASSPWTAHSPVLIQKWIKPLGNGHNILPVVQKEHKTLLPFNPK